VNFARWLDALRASLSPQRSRRLRQRPRRRRDCARTRVQPLEFRVLLSASGTDDTADLHAHGPAGVDVAYGVFTPEEYAALEAVPLLPEWSAPTISFAEDGSGQNNTNTVTIVLDFKTVAEGTTTDVFGNEVGAFDVTSFGFAANQFDEVVAAIAAEVDEDYFSELVGTVAGPAGRDLKIDFVVGDFGAPPPGPTEYYYVQIGSGLVGPHTGSGTLGVAASSSVRTETGVANQNGLAGVAIVSSIFTDNIQGLGGLAPGNALSSGNTLSRARWPTKSATCCRCRTSTSPARSSPRQGDHP
jgi:hypothetical protein